MTSLISITYPNFILTIIKHPGSYFRIKHNLRHNNISHNRHIYNFFQYIYMFSLAMTMAMAMAVIDIWNCSIAYVVRWWNIIVLN